MHRMFEQVAINVPLTPKTRKLFNASVLSKMKKGAVLVRAHATCCGTARNFAGANYSQHVKDLYYAENMCTLTLYFANPDCGLCRSMMHLATLSSAAPLWMPSSLAS